MNHDIFDIRHAVSMMTYRVEHGRGPHETLEDWDYKQMKSFGMNEEEYRNHLNDKSLEFCYCALRDAKYHSVLEGLVDKGDFETAKDAIWLYTTEEQRAQWDYKMEVQFDMMHQDLYTLDLSMDYDTNEKTIEKWQNVEKSGEREVERRPVQYNSIESGVSGNADYDFDEFDFD